MYEPSDIIVPPTVGVMVDKYQQAIDDISAGMKTIAAGMDLLADTFGKGAYFRFDYGVYGSGAVKGVDKEIDDMKERMLRIAWERVIDLIGVRKILSVKRADKLDASLSMDTLPPLTLDEILAIYQTYVENVDDYAKEIILEAFVALRPARSTYGQHYKTNVANGQFEIGKKIIVTFGVEAGYGQYPWHVSYQWGRKHYSVIDRAFHALDHNLAAFDQANISPLIDAINTCKSGSFETAYFSGKLYKNCNLHLTFKRMDLVAEMNRIGGENERSLQGRNSK